MTTRRDLYAKSVVFRVQADGTAGALFDHSRAANPVMPNDYATDAVDQLYGVNSFTGHPELPGLVFGPAFTLEGYVQINPTGADQTLISSLSPNYYRSTEWGLTMLGSNAQRFDVYQGVRGSSEIHAQPQFANPLPTGSWVHFFLCSSAPGQFWMGVAGVLSSRVATSSVGSTYGHPLNTTQINGINPAFGVSQSWLGRIHSLMVTNNVVRYPFNTSGVYAPPDDLLTNWYQDLGPGYDPADGSTDFQTARPIVFGGARFQSGDRKIAGHVTYSGVVSARRVVLFERGSQLPIATTTSRAADGYFEFLNLDPRFQYVVAGFDDAPGALNAEIADHLVPA